MTIEPYEITACIETDEGTCGVHDTSCDLASADWNAYLRRLAAAWKAAASTPSGDYIVRVEYPELAALLDTLTKAYA